MNLKPKTAVKAPEKPAETNSGLTEAEQRAANDIGEPQETVAPGHRAGGVEPAQAGQGHGAARGDRDGALRRADGC